MESKKINSYQLHAEEALFVIIDVQDGLVRAMDSHHLKHLINQVALFMALAQEESLPVILTEQYPRGLGATIEPIQKLLANLTCLQRFEKVAFSCCGDHQIHQAIQASGKKKIVLLGMEAHVCVYLTALDLRQQGYDVFVVQDGVISQSQEHYQNALELYQQIGCVVANGQTLLFQMLQQAGTPQFKKISKMLKEMK